MNKYRNTFLLWIYGLLVGYDLYLGFYLAQHDGTDAQIAWRALVTAVALYFGYKELRKPPPK